MHGEEQRRPTWKMGARERVSEESIEPGLGCAPLLREKGLVRDPGAGGFQDWAIRPHSALL